MEKDKFKPTFTNGAEVARRAEEHSKTLTAYERRRNRNRARRPNAGAMIAGGEARRFRPGLEYPEA